MDSFQSEINNTWTEDVSRDYINFGSIFIPDREHQMRVIVRLLGDLNSQATVLELCCGEGLLAEKILETYPGIYLRALDGSLEMLKRARERLARFEDQAKIESFNLASPVWRTQQTQYDGIVSSLAIHHLPGREKLLLFQSVFQMLAPGGILIIGDVVEIVGTAAKQQAADELDQIVRRQSLERTGNLDAYNFFIAERWNMHRYLDPDDIDKPSPLLDQLKWLEDAGFVEINVCWLLAGHVVFCARKPTI